MNCKNCGAQLIGNETACPICGNPIDNNVVPTQAPAVETPAAPVAPVAPVVETPAVETPATPVAPVAPVAEAPAVEMPAAPVAPVAPVAEAPAVEMPAAPVAPVAPVVEAPAVETPAAPVAPVAPVVETPAVEMPAAPVAPVAPVVEAPAVEMPAAPVAPAEIQSTTNPFMASNTNMNPFQNAPIMPEATQNNQPVNQKKPVNVKFIIFLIVGLLLIGFSLFWTYVVQADPEEPEAPAVPDTPTVETITYDGQNFTLPDGYELKSKDDAYGAIISNGENTYTVAVDYYNDYDLYKKKVTEVYPDKATSMIKKINDKEYIIIDTKDDTEAIANMYITQTEDEYILIGFITNKDFEAVTEDDYKGLSKIVENIATKEDYDTSDSTFGKDGIKLLTFDKKKLS